MTRLIVTAFALFLTAGALSLSGVGSGVAPVVAASADRISTDDGQARQPLRLDAAAMIVLTAADTDRGRPGLEQKKAKQSPPATGAASPKPRAEKVLPERHEYADLVELTVLMASGFVLGAAGFLLGRVWAGIVTAGFSGLAVGAAVYAFAFSSQVAQPNMTVAAGLLIFSASALAPTLFGRAGLAAARRVGQRLFHGRDNASSSTQRID